MSREYRFLEARGPQTPEEINAALTKAEEYSGVFAMFYGIEPFEYLVKSHRIIPGRTIIRVMYTGVIDRHYLMNEEGKLVPLNVEESAVENPKPVDPKKILSRKKQSGGWEPHHFREGHKALVEQIKALPWESLDPQELQQLMYLAWIAAQEFAEALRIARRLYPKDENLKRMAAGELKTKNLDFDGYNKRGDHSEFLKNFLDKIGFQPDENLRRHGEEYLEACRALNDKTRAMSVFSREEELSGIFARILQAQDWSAPGLEAFRYFMEKHIQLDSEEGGHHDLTKGFPVDYHVQPFYRARLKMYEAIPRLFGNSQAA